MSIGEIIGLAGSLFSIALAVFVIWLSMTQRKESQSNCEKTKDVLSELDAVMKKTETQVSENFQNLLKSLTEQQNSMIESLRPRPSAEDRYAEIIGKIIDNNPDKLETILDAIPKIQQS